MKEYGGTLSISFDIPFCISANNEKDAEEKIWNLNVHAILREYDMNTDYITEANIDAVEWEEE